MRMFAPDNSPDDDMALVRGVLWATAIMFVPWLSLTLWAFGVI